MDLVVPLAGRTFRLQALPPAARDATERGTDADIPERVRELADEALQRGETHYTDRPGIMPLRQQVAAWLGRRFGIEVDAGSGVVITCGGTEARFVAVQQLLPTGGTLVALSNPERVAGACIVRDVTLAGPEASLTGTPDGSVAGPGAGSGAGSEAGSAAGSAAGSVAGLAEGSEAGAVAIYLDGTTPKATADRWLTRAAVNGWPVVFEAGFGGPHPAASGLADLTITIGSLGLEQGLAAWRVGYLAAPAAKAGPLRDFKQALTLCTTNVSQWGALGLEERGS